MCVQSQYSLLRHLCWGMLLNHDANRTWVFGMSEYALYLDDGGHPDDKPHVVIAGYIATEEQWLTFEPAWKHKLEYFGLDYPFHMTDFMRQHRSDVKRDWILAALAHIVNRHTKSKFASAVKMSDYKRVNETYSLQEEIGAPLALTAREVARQLNKWKRDFFLKNDHLLIFMEQGAKHFGDVIQVFKRDNLPIPGPVEKSN